jgi:hypothetical protein
MLYQFVVPPALCPPEFAVESVVFSVPGNQKNGPCGEGQPVQVLPTPISTQPPGHIVTS